MKERNLNLSIEDSTEIYGLFKQALHGDNNEETPKNKGD